MATRRGAPPPPPSLAQFVILSILLHALFIALFGAPSGGSPGGRAMWGSLDVVLKGPLSDVAPSLLRERRDPDEFPAIAVKPRPTGGSAAEAPRAPARPSPPAPALDLSAPTETDRRPTPEVRPATPPAESVPATDPPPAPAEAPFVSPPLLERLITPDVKTEMLPPVQLPPPVEAPVIPAPMAAPAAPPQLRPMAPRVELPPPEAVPDIPAAMPALAPPPRIDRLMAPRVELPPVERAPVETPVIPAAPAGRDAASRSEGAPAPVERAAPREAPAPPAVERASPRDSPVRAEGAARAPAAGPDDRPSDVLIRRRDAAPEASDTGPAPRIDLEAARRRAREMAREGTGNRALLPFPMPPKPEQKSKEAIALEKALKPECKTAYQGLGLLAVVPLIANEFGEGNCRW